MHRLDWAALMACPLAKRLRLAAKQEGGLFRCDAEAPRKHLLEGAHAALVTAFPPFRVRFAALALVKRWRASWCVFGGFAGVAFGVVVFGAVAGYEVVNASASPSLHVTHCVR